MLDINHGLGNHNIIDDFIDIKTNCFFFSIID